MLLFLLFSAVLSSAVAYGFYETSLAWFNEHKSEEKITALRLVEAFVDNYSRLRQSLGADAPVPATFRAHSIELFTKAGGNSDAFRLQWVGRTDRAIATPPSDADQTRTIEAMAAEADPKPRASLLAVNGETVFRTVYPSLARQQSCVDCHNKIQPDQHWKLGDLMGAFVIDVPTAAFIRTSEIEASGLGLCLMLALSGFGVVVALLHRRQAIEREIAQASLEDSEHRFRDFAETASDWFWEQDSQLRFTFVSRGSPDGTTGGVIGKTRADLVAAGQHLDTSDEQLNEYNAAIEARRPFQNLRLQRTGPDGSVRHICVAGRPIFDADGNFSGYRGTGRDVTNEVTAELDLARRVEDRTIELRQAQSDLVRKEKLSTLGQLTATVAHELRNPLSAIRNTVYAIKETVSRSGLDLERPLTRVERNIQRCDRIITDLIDFTRIRDISRVKVEVDRWLDDVLAEQQLPQGVVLRRAFGAPRLRVNCDPERMRRVIINLVDNAAQAMADNADGERTITVETRADGETFEIAIADTGPGIPGDVLAKVFEPLFSTKNFGTGLGLPTVRQIVEQHGGTVEIASAPGKGTRVAVRLPCNVTKELAA